MSACCGLVMELMLGELHSLMNMVSNPHVFPSPLAIYPHPTRCIVLHLKCYPLTLCHPVLSANNEMEVMMKGIKHGSCDYLVKPVHLEQVRNIWMHVVRKNKADPRNKISNGTGNAGQKLRSGDDNANQTKTHSKKNKKDGVGIGKDKEQKTAQKKPRMEWCAELHQKFVEAID